MELPESWEQFEPLESKSYSDKDRDMEVRMLIANSCYEEIMAMTPYTEEEELSLNTRHAYRIMNAVMFMKSHYRQVMQICGYSIEDQLHLAYKDAAELVLKQEPFGSAFNIYFEDF